MTRVPLAAAKKTNEKEPSVNLRHSTSLVRAAAAVALVAGALAASEASAQARRDEWRYAISAYVWVPSVEGTANFPSGSGTTGSMDTSQVLDSLEFAFMATFEARKGRWGGFTDVIYLDLANGKTIGESGSLGGNLLPPVPTSAALSADLSLKGWVWTAVAEYAALEDRKAPLDVFGGFRYLTLTNELNWQFTGNIGSIPPVQQAGSTSSSGSFWDAIVGVKGRLRLGDGGWFLPYYLDVGTGQSESTLQALVGVGYAFSWGDVVADYRRLDYHIPEHKMLSDISLKGGLVGVLFRW